MKDKSMKKTADFIFELGQLKRVKRSGWWLINIKEPESVAEHSFRAAAIGFILARLENADADKVTKMCLFNDIHEARINDLHKLGQRYIDFKKAEKRAFEEQAKTLPKDIGDEIKQLLNEFTKDETKEGIIARDADYLECAFQAKEYAETGNKEAQSWIDNVSKNLKTKSAKKLLKEMKSTSPNNWWKGLKNTKR